MKSSIDDYELLKEIYEILRVAYEFFKEIYETRKESLMRSFGMFVKS